MVRRSADDIMILPLRVWRSEHTSGQAVGAHRRITRAERGWRSRGVNENPFSEGAASDLVCGEAFDQHHRASTAGTRP
jgi:hypothetical protein